MKLLRLVAPIMLAMAASACSLSGLLGGGKDVALALLPLLKSLPLPVDKVADYGARVADALESLHGQGVVHLDLKPGNLMRTPDGHSRLEISRFLAPPVVADHDPARLEG